MMTRYRWLERLRDGLIERAKGYRPQIVMRFFRPGRFPCGHLMVAENITKNGARWFRCRQCHKAASQRWNRAH